MPIDYTKENFEELPEKFDVVYDAVGKIFHLSSKRNVFLDIKIRHLADTHSYFFLLE